MDDSIFAILQKYLSRPALYEKTAEKFWTDPHIAAQMLKSHLDPDAGAASFKHEFIDRSVRWIAALPLPENARLLDIGCGPGLFTMRFAERGLRVTGLDFSENSIKYARAHDTKSEYVIGDYLTMDFENTFDIITLINFDFGALIPDERHNLLRRVYRALKSGGRFLFDVFTPLQCKGKSDSRTWEVNPDGGFMDPNPHVCLYGEYFYDEIAEGGRYVIINDQGARCFNLWNCYFTRQSLADELTLAGYAGGPEFYNDVAGEPYADDTHRMCAIFLKN
jgi:SAM-dependent methyltransferase